MSAHCVLHVCTPLCFHLAARQNEAPVAIIKPTTQQVNAPNDVVIDGSGQCVRLQQSSTLEWLLSGTFRVLRIYSLWLRTLQHDYSDVDVT